MYDRFISERISKLRIAKKVSARDMSLTIGQNENYINHIENGKSMPSMQVFFYICEYFNITPKDFFDEETNNPSLLNAVLKDLNALTEHQILNIHEIVKGLKK
ncbi:helix-turn-helix domain-containing protein [Anaerotignum propionicum]|uniref:DNA-binding transcriptional regulator, XRE-family HTH domain n=1 Tax=Anaerotignum propionicum DSM 1682 TaxID=991789 RepID=A0A0X8VCT9_ANAPI|nr:helix-turn-helix transcriptional regulator [Anaerotignum propionicum]AMJ41591.1 helix-turn-helix domain protein [Anaerotignum propionicum DSM 1682]SHE86775.1 DNA-binding transcriptional regulator, XRE-family HTH domain [[Clostridium] propionicum DSM 1682] [Anaerotignum propionicum DSM 1682]